MKSSENPIVPEGVPASSFEPMLLFVAIVSLLWIPTVFCAGMGLSCWSALKFIIKGVRKAKKTNRNKHWRRLLNGKLSLFLQQCQVI
jgi:hypothetical protein